MPGLYSCTGRSTSSAKRKTFEKPQHLDSVFDESRGPAETQLTHFETKATWRDGAPHFNNVNVNESDQISFDRTLIFQIVDGSVMKRR